MLLHIVCVDIFFCAEAKTIKMKVKGGAVVDPDSGGHQMKLPL